MHFILKRPYWPFSSLVLPTLSTMRIFKPNVCADREAGHRRAEPQHPGPLGDRPDQPQVYPEAGPWSVWGSVGGALEQHNTGGHQNFENR